MQSKYKIAAGSLAGAVAIQVAFAACGGGGSGGGTASGGHPGAEAGLLDALVDHISTMLDGTTTDAHADVDAGGDAGTCGCAVSLSGPIQSVPASENSAQLVRGSVVGIPQSGSILVTGPFVLTDATGGSAVSANPGTTGNGQGALLYVTPIAATCGADTMTAEASPGYIGFVVTTAQFVSTIHGGHYIVPAGQMLCASEPDDANGWVQWAGYKPYQ